jgi:hypothetical protein
MMMKTFSRAAMLFALIASSVGSVRAEEPTSPGDDTGSQIVVVNKSVTPVRIYIEDSEGHPVQLGIVDSGEAKTLQAPAEIVGQGAFRVQVRPSGYMQHRRDPVSIKTGTLHVEENGTVILWLERELSRSRVEVRAG